MLRSILGVRRKSKSIEDGADRQDKPLEKYCLSDPSLVDSDGSSRFSRVTGQSPQLQSINTLLDQPIGTAGNPHELRYFSESGKGWLFVLIAQLIHPLTLQRVFRSDLVELGSDPVSLLYKFYSSLSGAW